MAKAIDESDVGISCYVSSVPGFRAVLKQRYSDFIVNEVDLDGRSVRLTSFDMPVDCAEEEENGVPLVQKSFADDIETFRSLAGDANAELLKEFLQKITDTGPNDLPPIVLAPDRDKSHRAEVHNFFKNNLKFLITDTVDGEDGNSKCIRVRYSSSEIGSRRKGKKRKDRESSGRRNDRPFDSRGADNWPEDRGRFLRFHLYKENKDTHEALGVIGKMLGIQQRSFGFAGTKDKRAVTTQRVSVFKLHPKRLAALNSRLYGIKVGNFGYEMEGLLLGQLLGNRFTITLRSVVAVSRDAIKAAAEGLGRNGFINYYGLQRFGSGSMPTHRIGTALLKGEWKTAVDLILDPRDEEQSATKDTRLKFKQTGDVDFCLRQLPRHLVAERSIVHSLKKCPGNYLQALQAIPRTLRLMYVHSYQSYLWNHAASMRVAKHGMTQVVMGDLVFGKEDLTKKVDSFESIESAVDRNDGEDNNMASDVAVPEENVQLVKVINSDDLLKGAYSVEDIVLPLPGSKIIYPENGLAEFYHDLAKMDDINLTESVHNVKEFSITNMTGGYRRLFQRPEDFTWELLTYTDANEALAKTDLDFMSLPKPEDLMEKEDFNNENSNDNGEDQEGVIAAQADGGCSGPNLALKLCFTLPASCYATMAIRELLKSSTSVAYQKTLNQ